VQLSPSAYLKKASGTATLASKRERENQMMIRPASSVRELTIIAFADKRTEQTFWRGGILISLDSTRSAGDGDVQRLVLRNARIIAGHGRACRFRQ